ncbi:hypothetical protein MKX08_004837 [Trichoderma sp. CBMAI-0020]|nr:hypothetical protein MKX08_004837 [Trichoderma sp. CBMAI-0020]
MARETVAGARDVSCLAGGPQGATSIDPRVAQRPDSMVPSSTVEPVASGQHQTLQGPKVLEQEPSSLVSGRRIAGISQQMQMADQGTAKCPYSRFRDRARTVSEKIWPSAMIGQMQSLKEPISIDLTGRFWLLHPWQQGRWPISGSRGSFQPTHLSSPTATNTVQM